MRLSLFSIILLVGCAGPYGGDSALSKRVQISDLDNLTVTAALMKIRPKKKSFCEAKIPTNIFKIKFDENDAIINGQEYIAFANKLTSAKLSNGNLITDDNSIEVFFSCGSRELARINLKCREKYTLCQTFQTLSNGILGNRILSDAEFKANYYSPERVQNRIAKKKKKELEDKQRIIAEKQLRSKARELAKQQQIQEDKNKLATLEKKCSSFGYKKGTEKFADCMRELYVLDAQAKSEAKSSAETQARINRENQATIGAARRELEALRAEQEAQRKSNERQQGWEMFQKGIEMMNPSSPSTNRTYNCSVSDAYGNVQCK